MERPKRVCVIGAGPIGVELCLRLLKARVFEVFCFEKGSEVGFGISETWPKVKMFSPWNLNTTGLGRQCLVDIGLLPPENGFSDGRAFLDQYLIPLSQYIQSIQPDCIRKNVVVEGVCRDLLLKNQLNRSNGSFRILVSKDGDEEIHKADIVIDTTGVHFPNSAGCGGIVCPGERKARELGLVSSIIPKTEDIFNGKRHIVVIGSGYSAITTLDIVRKFLDNSHSEIVISWVTRRAGSGGGEDLYRRIAEDPLPQRDALSVLGNRLCRGEDSRFTHIGGATIHAMQITNGKLSLTAHISSPLNAAAADATSEPQTVRDLEDVDLVFCHTGSRPDTEMTRELQIHYCYASEGPMKLAAALLRAGGGGGDCLASASCGSETLRNPEPNFFILGSKSYGRGAAFLLRLGHQQIEEVMEILIGPPSEL